MEFEGCCCLFKLKAHTEVILFLPEHTQRRRTVFCGCVREVLLKQDFGAFIGSLRLCSHRGIGYMQNMRPFKSVCPLRNELHLDITTAAKVTAKRCNCNSNQ